MDYDSTYFPLTNILQESKYISYVDNLKSTACQLKYPVSIPDISVLTVDEEDAIMPIACTRQPQC